MIAQQPDSEGIVGNGNRIEREAQTLMCDFGVGEYADSIVEAQVKSTNLNYTIEDGTGQIEVMKWTNSDDSQFEVQRREQLK